MTAMQHTQALSARLLVFTPLAVLSALFIAILGALAGAGTLTETPSLTVVGLAVTAYLAALVMLGRVGLANVQLLERESLRDGLTGLPNRRALHADLARRFGRDTEVALAIIDLDGFKLINDNHSHVVGDRLIVACAEILRDMGKADIACFRLGGDEFALAAGGPLAGTILEGVCRAVIDRLGMPVEIDSRRLSVGASIGVVRWQPGEAVTPSEMLRRADMAMYASKRSGRNRCSWYTPEFDALREETARLDSEMRAALVNCEFDLHYQPLVDARTRQVVAVESLLRWHRRAGGPVGPDVFIPVAEESGFINTLGLWVLRRACQDALAWDGLALSVNVSAAQLRNPEFPLLLGQLLEETGFPPERLELEITETSLVIDPVLAERSLQLIRSFGVNIALDDFGTGYASIGVLRRFRFEKLKLDRSLVRQASSDAASRAVMLSSITMARAMDMGVTAEGVETEAEAEMVRAAGCDQIQGWLFHKAMSARDLGTLLAAQQPAAPSSLDTRATA